MQNRTHKTNHTNKSRAVGVRLEANTLQQLEEISAKEDRSLSQLVRMAVREFLQRKQQESAAA